MPNQPAEFTGAFAEEEHLAQGEKALLCAAEPLAEGSEAWAHSLPKIDLHRHLEGSLRLKTLMEIARERDIELPSYNTEELRPYVQVTDEPLNFRRFLKKFQILRRFYTSKEAVQRITREAIADAAGDNIRYLELRFNPLALARVQNFSHNEVVEWVKEAAAEAEVETGTRTCLIFQIPRNEPLEVAEEFVDLAIAHFGRQVRGIDLAGNEIHYPPEKFARPFERAHAANLHITVHAGEAKGAESVADAMKYLYPQRIGHGIRAVENSQVVRMLYERRVTLEVCPTSNLHTGAVRGLSQHPLIDLFNLRLRVTLNTDDPSVSATTLSQEYVVAVNQIGLKPPLIYRMLSHSVEAAFIPDEERAWLRESIARELQCYPGALSAYQNEERRAF